jgi:hypothetical protein
MWPSGNHGANFFCKMLFCAGLALSMNARHQIVLATSIALTLWALPAYAQNGQQAASQSDQEPGRTGHAVNDEIQVYNAEIAKVGQWTIQFHNNYAINGRKEPDFIGRS